MNNNNDPRPIVREDFYALLDRLEMESALEVNNERPWKINVIVRTENDDVQNIAVSVHQKIRRIIFNGQHRFLIKEISIGQSYARFHLTPDWAYYMEQKSKQGSKRLQMDDIIPI